MRRSIPFPQQSLAAMGALPERSLSLKDAFFLPPISNLWRGVLEVVLQGLKKAGVVCVNKGDGLLPKISYSSLLNTVRLG
jgi:hypothetical protein